MYRYCRVRLPHFRSSYNYCRSVDVGCCEWNAIIIGASLSEPHTSETSLRRCVCIYTIDRPTVLVPIYRKF